MVVLFWSRVEAVVSADFRPPPWQRTGSHLRRRHGQIGRIRLRTAAPSTVFSRFSPVRVLFISKLEKVTRRAEIWVEWGGYPRHGGLLCRPPENVFFKRVKGVGASLGQVYRAKRRLCCEINRHFSKIFIILLYAKYLLDGPRKYVGWKISTKFLVQTRLNILPCRCVIYYFHKFLFNFSTLFRNK